MKRMPFATWGVTFAIFFLIGSLIVPLFIKPEVYSFTFVNDRPSNVLKGNPNLKILLEEKRERVYKFCIIADQINATKYWKKFGYADAILIVSDYSGFDGQGRRSIIFSDNKPDPSFFKVKKEI